MSQFFTSDPHIGHRLVAGIRGFWDEDNVIDTAAEPDPAAHAEWLADLWDTTVKPTDSVYVLGDLAMAYKLDVAQWFAERPGTLHLIFGNHDEGHPMHRTAGKTQERYLRTFTTVQPVLRKRLAGHDVLLSHFPYLEAADDPGRRAGSYEQWRLPDLGTPLLHGHTHGPEREHLSLAGTPQLHVGIDAWQAFVREDYIINWLEHPND